MPVKVTLELMLPEWWGADFAFDDGGPEGVKELILEDLSAFAEDAKWDIQQYKVPKR
jgi:hypothetical protein